MDLLIPGPAGQLQAALWSPPKGVASRAAVVVCHPHPLFGGTMNSTAVFRTARGLQLAGLQVLRFNFRGVGKSEGTHDGHGGEADDLGAALDWLEMESPGVPLWAGGFSFGARTAAYRASVDRRIERVVLVAFPVAAFDCSFIREVAQSGLVVMASNDEYGTLADVRRLFPDLHGGLELQEVVGSGHFFEGHTAELQRRVADYARRVLE
jgi:alpha/beta superfamily hydrolase